MRDLRYAARLLIKAPVFSATAVLILALAIAGNTATFSAVNVLLLEPLPFEDAERLVVVASRHKATSARGGVTDDDFRAWSAHAKSFDGLAAVRLEQAFNLSAGGEPLRVTGGRMTAGLLPLVGVQPVRGRPLTPDDERPGAAAVVLITEGFWDRTFDRAEDVVGREITVDGVPATIAGVLPASFRLIYGGYSIWAPIAPSPATTAGSRPNLVIGRLARDATPARAAEELRAMMDASERNLPEHARGWRPSLLALREFLIGGRRQTLAFVVTALALLLLVACANTASLQLARAAARQHEIATRLALGASRAQVVRQLLIEASIIASLAAALALALVALARQLLLASSPDLRELAISLPVLGFTVVLAAATTVAFGLVPALTGTRIELAAVLKGAGAPRRTARRLLSTLVVVELSSSLVLLVPAGLLFKSFLALRQMQPGFVAESVLTFSIALPAARYSDGRRQQTFYDEALARLSALPGVRAAAAGDALPLEQPPAAEIEIDRARSSGESAARGRTVSALARTVSPDYFRALGVVLRAGRSFDRSDAPTSERVAIVNETLASMVRPDGNALGATIRLRDDGPVTIVGVASDLRSVGLRVPPQPEMMLPMTQHPRAQMSIAVATTGDVHRYVAPVREAVRALDRGLPLGSIRPMTDALDEQIAAVRVIAGLLAALAGLALALAAAGLSGLMSRLVAQRTREFGVRAALGATRRDLVALVMRDAARLVACGVALGVPAAVVVARVAASVSWGVSAADPQTFVLVPVALAVAACAACYVPARSAAHLDPARALRAD